MAISTSCWVFSAFIHQGEGFGCLHHCAAESWSFLLSYDASRTGLFNSVNGDIFSHSLNRSFKNEVLLKAIV